MELIQLYLVIGGLILILMTLLWLASLTLRNSSIVDIFWGAGFVIVAWVTFALTPSGFADRKWLLAALVTIWGLRLSLYILSRNFAKPEDYRYQLWRKEAGAAWWWRSYYQVFIVQGVILWIVAAPIAATLNSPMPNQLILLDYLALPVWIIGFFFEAAGDWQLARFRANPANNGRVLNTGVWRYTRHPNYFGDATQWWAFYLIAAAAGGWWTLFSPIIMTALLLRVSGVTLLEKTLKESKPGYAEYARTTSEFIPWFPHKSTR
jgi:steroid 5-alpha reductase family enzyme